MAHLIDLEEAQAILTKQREVSDPYLKTYGLKGTIARSVDVHETMTLWRIGEANLKSDPNDIMTALFNLFVNAVAAEIETNGCHEHTNEMVSSLTAEFHDRVLRVLKIIHQAPSLEPKEVGTA